MSLHAIPEEPFQVLAVALVLAHVGLSAIWWARSQWPLSGRSIAAFSCCAVLWLLLIMLLDTARGSGLIAAGWAACLAIQVAMTALGALAIEAAIDFRATATRNQFSLAFLVGATTAVATVLGALGTWAARHGWKVADVPGWEYFWQLQFVGLLNAALAVLSLASVRLSSSWRAGGFAIAAVMFTAPAIVPLLFWMVFAANAGAKTVDLVWLFAAQGLFIAAALVPAEIVRAARTRCVDTVQAASAAESTAR
jgi:hypothetical protein